MVRENGFSPLGIPQRRGLVYTIAVIDRGGGDGRLIIDARTGRIIRFLPAYRHGQNFQRRFGLPRPARHAADDQCPGARRGRRVRPECREPHGADAEGQPARRQARGRTASPAIGGPTGASNRRRCSRSRPRRRRPPGDNRRSPSPSPQIEADHRHRDSAERRRCRRCRGLEYATDRVMPDVRLLQIPATKRPRFRGVFMCGAIRCWPAAARIRSAISCPAATPATGGRRPVPPSSHSSAWPETVPGRD